MAINLNRLSHKIISDDGNRLFHGFALLPWSQLAFVVLVLTPFTVKIRYTVTYRMTALHQAQSAVLARTVFADLHHFLAILARVSCRKEQI